MPNTWPLVPLGELLTTVSRPESVDPEKTYRILGAHWYAGGLYIKQVTTGAGIQAKSLSRVKEDDFVYNRLFAWKGSFAVATKENHGCYVSNEFPCFTVIPSRLNAGFLWRYFSRSSAWDEALAGSTGGTPTSRNRLKENKFLAFKIPLPPLDEQRRIVARIEALAAKIEEIRCLRQQQDTDVRRTLVGAYQRAIRHVEILPMEEVAPLIRRPIAVCFEDSYPELGIRSFGKGTFHKPPILGAALGTKRIFRIEADDLLFNIVFAWEGAVAVARREDHGWVGSHRFLTCVPRRGVATSNFLRFHFLTDEGIEALGSASPGGAGRNRTLGLDALRQLRVPVPPYDTQVSFDTLQAKVDALKKLQAETAAEVDALLPSVLDKAFKGEL